MPRWCDHLLITKSNNSKAEVDLYERIGENQQNLSVGVDAAATAKSEILGYIFMRFWVIASNMIFTLIIKGLKIRVSFIDFIFSPIYQ